MVLCALTETLFDIDQGHKTVAVYPEGLFTEQELSDIAFNAFPDSMSMELRSSSSVRDSSFCFRLRRDAPPPGAPAHLQWLYGHVFCRQRQDERLRRGCEQKSIVLLSWLPLHSVLEPLARLVGPTVLSYGPDALRQVFEEVQQWPPLDWGCRMELPVLGVETLRVQLPLLSSLPSSTLPAAVAAGLGQYAVAAALSQPAPNSSAAVEAEVEVAAEAGDGANEGERGGSGEGPQGLTEGVAAAPETEAAAGKQQGPAAAAAPPVAAAAAQAAAAAAAAAMSGPVQAAATPHLLVASPAQVATSLADELDGCGLPLGLLPQAYGQQEAEASPWGDCDCFTPLRASLPQLWALWELLLLGEPLMVVAPSPGVCSSTVAALLSLLAPFPYSLDWRPYYTIHDASFARLAAGELPTASNGLPMLLGCTNQYFLKALPEWPNVLATGYTAATVLPSSSSECLDELARSPNGGSMHSGGSMHMHPSQSAPSMGSSSSGSNGGGGGGGVGAMGTGLGGGGRTAGGGSVASSSTSRLGGLLRRGPASPAVLLSEPVDHCWLAYKPLTRPDKAVLEQLVQPQPTDPADKWQRLAAINSAMLRRHFQALTKALLAPLLPYMSPCLPPPPADQHGSKPKAPAMEPPPLPRLDVPALLARLSSKDARLPELLLQRFGGQRGLLHFYERFFRSPNLVSFMHLRRLAAVEWQRQEWEAASLAAAAPMQELLTVEAFFHLEQRLAAARQQLATAGGGGGGSGMHAEAAALAEQLQQELQLAFTDLPEDLQAVILQTPSHAEMLEPGGTAAREAAAAAVRGDDAQQQQ